MNKLKVIAFVKSIQITLYNIYFYEHFIALDPNSNLKHLNICEKKELCALVNFTLVLDTKSKNYFFQVFLVLIIDIPTHIANSQQTPRRLIIVFSTT